jgi:hypothetical protein
MAIDVGIQGFGLAGREEEATDRVMVRTSGFYAFAREPVQVPVSPTESIDSGAVLLTLDPESDASANVGVADFKENTMRMRNTIQATFHGLREVAASGEYDRSLLNPPRGIMFTDVKIDPDYSGWEAQSCLDFLPGSIWSGAGGG